MKGALITAASVAAGYFAARLADHLLGLDHLAAEIAEKVLAVAPWLRLDGAADVTREVSLG